MANIRNIKDLLKYVNSDTGKQRIMSDVNVRKALNSELERLQRYLIEEINAYLDSYSPVQYQRTGAWLESIKVNPIQQNGKEYSASITFEDSLAYHDSLFGGEQGYVPWLFEVGYHWDESKQPRIPRLSDFDGIHYIKRSVERWNRDNKFGFKIAVYHGDERYI